jgi:hypothetical protein
LNKNYIIRQLLAAFMLCVFLFGITPKKVWHSLVANHTDNTVNTPDSSKPIQISKAGFHCQVDNLVAESPFETHPFSGLSVVHAVYAVYAVGSVQIISFHVPDASLRGPPAFA